MNSIVGVHISCIQLVKYILYFYRFLFFHFHFFSFIFCTWPTFFLFLGILFFAAVAKCAARSKNGKFLFRYFYFFDKGTQKSTKMAFLYAFKCWLCVRVCVWVYCMYVCVCLVGVLALCSSSFMSVHSSAEIRAQDAGCCRLCMCVCVESCVYVYICAYICRIA